MTSQQNRREGDEKITGIHLILLGDVIAATVRGVLEKRANKKQKPKRLKGAGRDDGGKQGI